MRTRWRQAQQGSTTVELVIGTVVMALFLLVVLQVAIYCHARSVATTAARHGLDQGRVVNGDVASAEAATNEFLEQAGSSIDGPEISAARSEATTSVRVRGTTVAVVPGLHLSIDVRASAPTERETP